MDDMKLMGFPIGVGIVIGMTISAVVGETLRARRRTAHLGTVHL